MADKYIIIIGILICGFALFGYITPFLREPIEMLTKMNPMPIALIFGTPFFCGVAVIIIGVRSNGKT
ncbi:MAG: hypothetical protein HY223_00985 [Thaumarchaeota archaeon]|nr:hypothetical protein [Nitrososphaerota archaeon]